MIRNPEFLKLLISRGILKEEDCQRLSLKYKEDAFSVLLHLLREGAGKKDELGRLWGDSIRVPYVDLEKTLVQHAVVEMLPESLARKHKMIPLYQFGETITVATSNPRDPFAMAEAEKVVGKPISPVFAFPGEIEDVIEIEYQSQSALQELTGKLSMDSLFQDLNKISAEQLKRIAGDQAVIEFTRGVLLLGVKERASDIHVEPGEALTRVRFRIDGVLQERLKLDPSLFPPLASRLKILANVDITEKRRPQDGRISLPLGNRSIDFRFSSVPTIYGEKIVLRILGQIQARNIPALSELNFSRSVFDQLIQVTKHPNGIFFVTGPTGSGKTTTLYSVLDHLNKPGINIQTIEDPVEYRLPGINQVQVNPGVELNFAAALRSFLRQDPDVILVGEIRDLETARIAAQAALTGHLVLTTLHTNNAIQAVTRLIDIGVEPFLVAPSIIDVMSQRLVRKICNLCKEKVPLSPAEIEKIFIWDGQQEVFFYRGKGCPQCNHTGYSGRIAIHEILLINDEIRALITRNASPLEIQECAKRGGFQTLRYDGVKKVLRGLTTMEEVDRVTLAEGE